MGSGIGDIGVRVSADITEFTSAMDRTAQVAATSMAHVERANRIAQAASDKFVKSLQYQIDTFGKTEAEILKYKAAQMGVSQTATPLIAQLEAMSAAAGGHAGSISAATKEMHGFSLESTRARSELLVLAHELSQGNFKKFGQSLLVLGESSGAASLLFSAAGVAAVGLGAAVVGVTAAVLKGAEEQRAMNNALIETGGYAGVTADGLNAIAHSAVTMGGSIGEAKKAVIDLAASGKFTSQQIGQIAEAAIAMEHATGKSVDETIKNFEALAVQAGGNTMKATEVISQAALKLDDQYHFLTEAVYENIRALEKEGDQKAASALAIEALAKTTKERAEEMLSNIGSIQRGWNSVKEAIGEVVDGLGKVGMKSTAATEAAKASAKLANFDNGLRVVGITDPENQLTGSWAETRKKLVLELVAAYDKLNQADAAAIAQGQYEIAQSEAKHAASRILQDDARLEKKGLTELQLAIRQYGADLAKVAAANPTSPLLSMDSVNAHMQAIYKAHTERIAHVKAPRDTTETILTGQLQELQANIEEEKQLYEARKKNLDLVYKNNMMSSADYYAATAAAQAEYVNSVAATYDQEIVTVKAAFAKDEEARRQHNNKVGQIEAAKRALLTGAQQTQAEASFGEAVLAPQKAYNQLLDQSNIIRKTASEYEKQIGIDERTNLISNLQGMIKIGAARRQELVDLQAVADRLDAIALANPLDRRMAAEALAMHAAIKNLQADADVLATHFDQLGVQGLSTFFENTLAGTKTVGQAFGDMTKMILNDILRMEAQAAASSIIGKSGIGGWLSDLVSLGTGGSGSDVSVPIDTSSFTNLNAYLDSLPHKAKGGYVGAGQTYMVGEVGPEVFTPSTSGTIIPNNKLGSGGDAPSINLTTNVSVNGTTSQSSGDAGSAKVMADALNNKVKEVIVREMRQGGVIWNYQNRGVVP